MKTTQELLDDLARRSGSPNLMVARSEPVHPPDTKHDVIAKFFQSQTEASANTTTAAASIVPKVERRHFAKPVSDFKDPVAEIYARLPPLDPAAIASLWSAETEQQPAEDDESPVSESPPPPRPPVITPSRILFLFKPLSIDITSNSIFFSFLFLIRSAKRKCSYCTLPRWTVSTVRETVVATFTSGTKH